MKGEKGEELRKRMERWMRKGAEKDNGEVEKERS